MGLAIPDPTLVRITMLTRTDLVTERRPARELTLRRGDKVLLLESTTGTTLTLRGGAVAAHTWLSTDGDMLLNDDELRQLIDILQSRLPRES